MANNINKRSLFGTVGKVALKAGRATITHVLVLYYCLQDRDTPAWAKGVIVSSLGYFIFPLDAIPDVIPGVGYTDDFGVLAAAISTVAMHIKQEHKAKAQAQLSVWFS